jgi:FMN phosphatase YigB (HAD superfamily)
METSQIKVIFFDVGGVLLSNGWGHKSRQKAAKVFGLNYDELDVLHNFIYNVYEIGRISLDDYLDTVVFNHPRDFTKNEFKNFMFAQSKELPELLQWLIKWKQGYSNSINTPREPMSVIREISGVDVEELFDHLEDEVYELLENNKLGHEQPDMFAGTN